ncbi:MAG: hypothetical protein HZB67_02440 [Candidatus Aenigmarchaeota archaeon]|nr:hypothetical protein [Candidatus Aenigmarchaeota archaeon]
MAASLVLKESEVPLSARVHMYEPGSNLPVEEKGKPVVLQRLIGGVSPMEARFYRIAPGKLEGWDSDFAEGIHFSPVEVYTPQDAPADRRYAVFLNGKRVIHDVGGPHPYEAAKSDGRIIVSCGFPFNPCSYAFAEYAARRAKNYSDEQLLEQLDGVREGFEILNINSYHKWQMEEDELLEDLARRHRSSVSGLVGLFERISPKHLFDMSLPADAQMVPIK